MIDLDIIAAAAESHVGLPFAHQGRSPGYGLDCAGSWLLAARAGGSEAQDASGYPSHGDPSVIEAYCTRYAEPREELRPGYSVTLTNRLGGRPRHIGTVSSSGQVIHALSGERFREEPLDSVVRAKAKGQLFVHGIWEVVR